MKRDCAVAFTVLLLCINAGIISSKDTEAAFLERARSATAKYQDQSIAILEGYRRIGRDFPAMGEHWIRLDLVFDGKIGKIEAEHPELLTYITVNGKAK